MAAAMRSHKLRPYQRTAIESALRALTKSGSCVLQMPTGAGKTRAATEIVATSRGVIWFVCHRQEIERQVAKAFTAAGINFGVVSPRGELEPKKRVQIVSVHTLRKRLKKLPAPKLVIWDECHHVAAKSWASIRAKLKDARHLGLTATPERLDGKGLGEWFAELVTGPGIAELIKKGFLSEFRYFAPSDPDLTNAKLQAGDYKKSDLGKIMNTPVLIGDAVREYKKHAKGKRALAFCASVESSLALAERFNKEGVKAAHVDGTTPTTERERLVEELAAGSIKVLCNVEVFTEGFDIPAIDAVILMRPTKSPTLLLQMIGRGLRKAPGKDVAIIMDHAGLHRDHAWFADDWPWSLDGGAAKARRAAVARGPRRCPECKEVRAERVEVCACGYEFPSGREIGEYDGVLTEIRGVVPDGHQTKAAFGRNYGVSANTVVAWIARGLPHKNGYIPTTAATWVESNINFDSLKRLQSQLSAAPSGLEKQNQFARRHGVSATTVCLWVKRGMPSRDGFIVSASADRWVQRNIDMSFVRRLQNSKRAVDGFMSVSAFAGRYGKPGAATSWPRLGLPVTEFGVPIKEGDDWVAKHLGLDENGIPVGLSKVEFADRFGLSIDAVRHLILRGMPTLRTGRISPSSAIDWAESNKHHGKTTPFWVTSPHEYELDRRFAGRVGVSLYAVEKWCGSGMPHLWQNKWVHIQRGLEWVRDNTDIEIPDSAWPKKVARAKRSRQQEEHRASI